MTDETKIPDATAALDAARTEAAQNAPRVQVHAQYVKDLSFENPGAPQNLANQSAAPKIEVSVDVGARGLSPNQFEVELRITANADFEAQRAFVVEVVYAGVFALHNVDQNQLKQVCLIECPRLLFPFARRIVADATRDGGFPPLLLEPIDFVQLYRQSMEKAEEQAAVSSDNAGESRDGGGGNGKAGA
ncbi:MAG: protein-export chaperone SecB [Proteobacteria bacterium]|nr:protein-export chaperone SecB [Pseudomonadota bacterium]